LLSHFPHFSSQLQYDRFSTHPFLTILEKKWFAYQLIHAVAQMHQAGVCHGDIKCENVMVTSWNWLFLTDFAPFKPTRLSDYNPTDINFYFLQSDRARCYLAPERFYSSAEACPLSLTVVFVSSINLQMNAPLISRLVNIETRPCYQRWIYFHLAV
jgi:serine/threonine protein kinase